MHRLLTNLFKKFVVTSEIDLNLTFMKRRGTVVDFPYHASQETSLSFRPSHRRSRTLSQISVSSQSSKLTLDLSKLPTATIGSYNASGSFSPTASARVSLMSLKGPSASRKRPSLDRISVPLWHGDVASRSRAPQSPDTDSPSPPSSPLSINSSLSSIPSISRTSSSFSALDVRSARDSTKRRSKAPLQEAEGRCNELHPVLAACEKMSKVSSQAVCATCRKPGYDYPRCAKCGEMWCSRACRLRDGRKRHVCSRTSI